VLVHCNAGRGRSVVATVAYLLLKHKADGWDRYTALEAVQRVRKTASLLHCCGTRPQWRAVCAFERMMHRKGLVCCPCKCVDPPVPYHNVTKTSLVKVPASDSPGSIRETAALPVAAGPTEEAGAGAGVGLVSSNGATGRPAAEGTRVEDYVLAPAHQGVVVSAVPATRHDPGAAPVRVSRLRPLPPIVTRPPDEGFKEFKDMPMPSKSAEPSMSCKVEAAGRTAVRNSGSLRRQLLFDEEDAVRASLSNIDLRTSSDDMGSVTAGARAAACFDHVILPGTPQR
jgi:hypothetical protein